MATRARAVALMRLGHLLSLQRVDEEQWALREVWRAIVLPHALRSPSSRSASPSTGANDSPAADSDNTATRERGWNLRGLVAAALATPALAARAGLAMGYALVQRSAELE